MERFIAIDNKIYSLKFGIESLMIMSEFLKNIDEQEGINLFFFLAIKDNNGSLTIEQSNLLLNQLIKEKGTQYVEELLLDIFECSLGNSIFPFNNFSVVAFYSFFCDANLSEQIEELYKKAVGEIGIAPHLFFKMSPHEIDLAYEGYLKKQELQANGNLIALRKSKDSKATLINMVGGEGYSKSTMAKRRETFDALRIE